jgi:hypothetical protein
MEWPGQKGARSRVPGEELAFQRQARITPEQDSQELLFSLDQLEAWLRLDLQIGIRALAFLHRLSRQAQRYQGKQANPTPKDQSEQAACHTLLAGKPEEGSNLDV